MYLKFLNSKSAFLSGEEGGDCYVGCFLVDILSARHRYCIVFLSVFLFFLFCFLFVGIHILIWVSTSFKRELKFSCDLTND